MYLVSEKNKKKIKSFTLCNDYKELEKMQAEEKWKFTADRKKHTYKNRKMKMKASCRFKQP